MENLTHTLVGLMMARCGLEKTAPRGAGMMMIAANIPDIDAVTWFSWPLYLEVHRSYTHSLAFSPLMAVLPLLMTRAGFSWRPYLASLAGVWSHLLLDWTNAYGVRMLLPFSPRWLRLDTVNLIDPWIWALLLIALAAPALSKLVSGEIGALPGSGPRRAWAWFALLGLFAYESGRVAAHDRAIEVMGARVYNGAPARNISAFPDQWNPLKWRGVIQGGDPAQGTGFVTIVPVDLTGDFDPSAGHTDYEAAPSPAIEAARRTRTFQGFLRFSQLPFWRATPGADGTMIEVVDLRFGTPEQPGFAAVTARVDAAGAVHDSRDGFGIRR